MTDYPLNESQMEARMYGEASRHAEHTNSIYVQRDMLLKALKDIRAVPGQTRKITPHVKDDIILEMDSIAYLAISKIEGGLR